MAGHYPHQGDPSTRSTLRWDQSWEAPWPPATPGGWAAHTHCSGKPGLRLHRAPGLTQPCAAPLAALAAGPSPQSSQGPAHAVRGKLRESREGPRPEQNQGETQAEPRPAAAAGRLQTSPASGGTQRPSRGARPAEERAAACLALGEVTGWRGGRAGAGEGRVAGGLWPTGVREPGRPPCRPRRSAGAWPLRPCSSRRLTAAEDRLLGAGWEGGAEVGRYPETERDTGGEHGDEGHTVVG